MLSRSHSRRKVIRRARAALAMLLPFLVIALAVSPARALTQQEAIVVVKLMQALTPKFGKLAYDEDAADDWFEADSESEGRIARAGFTRESWRVALGATVTGYIACLPEAEFRDTLASIRANAETRGSFTAEQRRVVMEFADEMTTRLETMRQEGRAHAEIVRPLAPRLRALMVE